MPLKHMLTIALITCLNLPVPAQRKPVDVFAKDNLVAWCIVPFDSKERSPQQRAAMLNDLGITRLAYDWRVRHVPTFDAEMDALKAHNIRLEAFWLPSGPDPANDPYIDTIFSLLRRHQVKTQLWCMLYGIPGEEGMTRQERIKASAKPLAWLARKAQEIGCTLGLYNHNGWFGEPENQLDIIQTIGLPNVGIVYNFSHSETQIRHFREFFPKILPHLHALNITGLIDADSAVVVPVGKGNLEAGLMRYVRESGYRGPIGIINESFAPDAADGLRMNIEGIKKILPQIGDKKALKTYK
ncbi:sugar phosphate isomerase/epimerase family protein [Chitinophaga lutea]